MRLNKSLLYALMVLTLLPSSIFVTVLVHALQEKKTLHPTADSDVFEEFPDWNTGKEGILYVRGDDTREILAYLMFDLGEVPSGAVIEEAKLRLYSSGETVPEGLVSVYYCPNNDWKEGEITYNNKPAFSPEPIDTVNVTTATTWYEWNLISTVQSTLEATDKRLSLMLKAHAHERDFYSRNDPYSQPPSSDRRPQLVVSYEAPPPSSINPILLGIIIVTAIAAAATTGLALTYTHHKRRKQPNPKPSTPH